MVQSCPFCGKPEPIEFSKLNDLATTLESGVIATQCCGKLLVVTPRIEYDMVAYQGRRKTDDYGKRETT